MSMTIVGTILALLVFGFILLAFSNSSPEKAEEFVNKVEEMKKNIRHDKKSEDPLSDPGFSLLSGNLFNKDR